MAYTTLMAFLRRFSLTGLLPLAAVAFSSGPGSSVVVRADTKVQLTNSPIEVTVSFTNGSRSVLRGFFFTQQIPAGLAVTTSRVTLNGRVVTNYTVECGFVGDVQLGYVPWRWKLETPTNFSEFNPVSSGVAAEIVFSFTSPTAGTVTLPGNSWAATAGNETNAVFGCSEDADQLVVNFVASVDSPRISAQLLPQGFAVNVDGTPNTMYLLSLSSNLVQWVPVATNLSPFTFTVTNWSSFLQQFYRASNYPNSNGARLSTFP
jgi:hypothetical protein